MDGRTAAWIIACSVHKLYTILDSNFIWNGGGSVAEAKTIPTTTGRSRQASMAPVKRTNSLHIADIIRSRILSGVLSPGVHLQEEGLASEFGTSRTPVRAALAFLVQESLLTYAPNRGYEVRRFTPDQILHAYDLRGELEGMAARKAAEQGISPEGERRMKACLEVVDAILGRGHLNDSEQGSWREMNVLFHSAIEEEVNNSFLHDTLQVMRNVPLVANAVVQWYDYDTVKRYHEDHHRIFDAIVRRQSSRASALMREHICQAREFVRTMLGERISGR